MFSGMDIELALKVRDLLFDSLLFANCLVKPLYYIIQLWNDCVHRSIRQLACRKGLLYSFHLLFIQISINSDLPLYLIGLKLMPSGAVSTLFNKFCRAKCLKSINFRSSETCHETTAIDMVDCWICEVSCDWVIFITFNQ